MKYILLGTLAPTSLGRQEKRTENARKKLKQLGIKLESVYYTQGQLRLRRRRRGARTGGDARLLGVVRPAGLRQAHHLPGFRRAHDGEGAQAGGVR
jgi:hypothetical protein